MPEGIAYNPANNRMYVTNWRSNTVSVIESSQGSSSHSRFGSHGTGDGQLSNFADIALDNTGNVYAADSGNHRIQKFTKDGEFITKWSNTTIPNWNDTSPYAIVADPLGIVYITDSSHHFIEKFTTDGKFITKWGSYVSAGNQFQEPKGVAVDRFGNVYTVDSGNYRIQVFVAPTP
jgi:DNA-binding beta-propeller fold protein YncE